MTVATAAVAVLPGMKMSWEEIGALRDLFTLRYICPCPPALPLSSTDWLIVDVAEEPWPIARVLVVAPPPEVVTFTDVTVVLVLWDWLLPEGLDWRLAARVACCTAARF